MECSKRKSRYCSKADDPDSGLKKGDLVTIEMKKKDNLPITRKVRFHFSGGTNKDVTTCVTGGQASVLADAVRQLRVAYGCVPSSFDWCEIITR